MSNVYIKIVGWYGVVVLLGAYALVSFDVISPDGFWFQFFNITGSIGIAIEASSKKSWPATVLNIVWAIIGAIALARIFI